MAKLADLSDSEDEEIVFMTAEERQKTKSNEKEPIDPGDTKYTTEDVTSIARLLEEHDIPCFVVGSSALRYYGAGLVQSYCVFAVRNDLHEKAVQLLSSQTNLITLGNKVSWALSGPSLDYPEFKLCSTTLRILLVPDRAWGLECIPSNMQKDDDNTSIPYPTLSHFAQSLLRTKNVGNLELLVDGQDSDMKWGFDNLEFGKHSWKKAVWEKTVNEKVKRIPMEKPKEIYATRFRRKLRS